MVDPGVNPDSFYRRPLPDGLVPFSSGEGRTLFREALDAGGMEGWFALSENFHTQADPAWCALGTLVVVLNALGIDPGRLWKGPWRWYSEELLDCCAPPERLKAEGVSLERFACLARCNGAVVEVVRGDTADAEGLRRAIRASTGSADGPHLVVNYGRRALGQTGEGHYSPVGGYHAGRDLVLMLDVARFKYPPHWVPVEALWRATLEVDPATGRARGWATVGRGAPPAVCFRVTQATNWNDIVLLFTETLHTALDVARPADATAVLVVLLRTATETVPLELRDVASAEHDGLLCEALDELRATPLYASVVAAGGEGGSAALTTLLVLVSPADVFDGLPQPARDAIAALRDRAGLPPVLAGEVARLGAQVDALLAAGRDAS